MGRQASLLTDSQREYLQEGKEGAAGRMARKRIRERAHEGLFDFPLLVSGLDEKDRKWVFEDHDLENKDHTLNVLSSAFAFLYLGITDTVEPSDLAKDSFEGIVAQGVKQAYLQRGETVRNVTVDIEVETGAPIEELREQDELHLFEILQMIEAGELPADEATELMSELLQERGDEVLGDDFQVAAASFPVDIFAPLLEPEEENDESDPYDPTKGFEDG